ncbi:M20/M25/M40 family metallo-hydrolase [Chloroflexota bacterium]
MNKQHFIQAIIIFAAIAAAVFVAIDQTLPPNALPASTPDTKFSAERAIGHIKVIAQEPRISGSPGYKNARDYVMSELTALGLTPEIQRATVTVPAELLATLGRSPDLPDLPPDEVENIIALIEGTQAQQAILLVVHLDSRGGPGATDNGSGVAVLLETARALRAGPPLRNSIILLFTDKEETGLYGAQAFITEHPSIDDVRLVINFDAGGLSGPSELTNISPDNGWLIRELAKADSYIYGSSASGEGSSDFNAFKFYGFSGYAFDYSWDRRIHTPNDNVENLNPASIQHQGYHALSLARHFGNLDSLVDPKDPNPIYFNVLRLGFVHYPTTWAIPIALVVVLVFAGIVALGFRRKVLTPSGFGLGALVFVISLITAPLLVSALWGLLSNALPTYKVTYQGHAANEPLLLILFTSITIALTTTWYALIQKIRQVSTPDLTIGAYAILAIATVGFAIAMPEASFLSAWAGLFGFLAVGYWFYSIKDDLESFSMGQLVVLILAAIIAIALMLQIFVAAFMGSEASDWIFPIVVMVMLLGLLVPQLQIITNPKKWWLSVAAWAAAAISLVIAILA